MSDAADLVFAGIARQAALVRSGQISSRELVEACLGRIARLDPALNAFRVVLGERASAEAEQADARRGAGDERPLPGVPVAVKDVADVAGETTTHGTGAHGPAADRDSGLVRRLRAAGAIIVGKTHTPELALAGMVGAATASDGLGSIRIPAACVAVRTQPPARAGTARARRRPLARPERGRRPHPLGARHRCGPGGLRPRPPSALGAVRRPPERRGHADLARGAG